MGSSMKCYISINFPYLYSTNNLYPCDEDQLVNGCAAIQDTERTKLGYHVISIQPR